MSFGYSIGDCITGANLTYQLIRALSGAHCPSTEYREALIELGCLQQTFLQVDRMTSNPTLSPATVNAASHIVLSSITLIGEFLEKAKRYQKRLDGKRVGNVASDSWQKVGWVLFKKDELKELKEALHIKLSSISLLLGTAQFYERMQGTVPVSSQYAHLAGEQASLTKPPTSHTGISSTTKTSEKEQPPQHGQELVQKAAKEEQVGGTTQTDPQSTSSTAVMKASAPLLPVISLRERLESARVVDLTPPHFMSTDGCKKALTTYEGYILQKCVPLNPKIDKSTWARTEIVKMKMSQEDIVNAIKRLSKLSMMPIEDKIAALFPFQHKQVNTLLGELNVAESDPNFVWLIIQMDRKMRSINNCQRETKTITLYLKRTPSSDSNVIALFEAWNRTQPNLSATSAVSQKLPSLEAKPRRKRLEGTGTTAGIVSVKRSHIAMRPSSVQLDSAKPHPIQFKTKRTQPDENASSSESSSDNGGHFTPQDSESSARSSTGSSHKVRDFGRHEEFAEDVNTYSTDDSSSLSRLPRNEISRSLRPLSKFVMLHKEPSPEDERLKKPEKSSQDAEPELVTTWYEVGKRNEEPVETVSDLLGDG